MRSAFSMVALLVVVAIIAILVVVMYGKGAQGAPPRADGKGETVIGRAKYAAKDDECRSGLSQIRSAIAIGTDPVEGTRPSTLVEARIGKQFTQCPVGGEPYRYDPATGKVQCPHAGHESY